MTKAQQITDKLPNQTTLSKVKFKLKFANFLKKGGFYDKAYEQVQAIEAESRQLGDKLFLYRLLRDKARILAILNKNDEAHQTFEEATTYLENPVSIKQGKLLYFQGLSKKRVSSEQSIEVFESALDVFGQVFESEENYYICHTMFEMGTVYRKMERYDDSQDMLTEAGQFISKYSDHAVFGDSRGENHPLMQQYFLAEIEWASSSKLPDIEAEMVKKYAEVVKANNQTKDKRSIFLIEPMF